MRMRMLRLVSAVKIAIVLENHTTEEQRSAGPFLWAHGLNAKDIHKEMFPVYGGKCSPRKVVHNCVQKFSQGRLKFVDDADQVALLRCNKSNCAAGGKVDLS
jgi:hypothetical protein